MTLGGSNPAVTFPDGTIQNTAFTTGAVTQATIGTGVAGTGPAFSAYNTSAQSVTSSTFTKITFDTEVFDTNNNFATSRFTPTVAGYYQINGILRATGTAMTGAVVAIYKNSANYAYGATLDAAATSIQLVASEVIYLNGSTDYLELYGYIVATSPTFGAASIAINCRFNGSMVRAA
jgi:hypothetical protein